MREFKFRVWSKENSKMIYQDDRNYFVGTYMGISGSRQTIGLSLAMRDDGHRLKLMQYTGEQDLNLVDIYEGDIVRVYSEEEHQVIDMLDEVVFKNGCFTTKEHIYDFYYNGGDLLEVKGNIHENRELIKE